MCSNAVHQGVVLFCSSLNFSSLEDYSQPLKKNNPLIIALDQIEEYKINKNVNSKISEKVIVFTGTLVKMSRSEAKTKAEELGAKVASAVSNNTDFVVVGKDSGSKEKKAKELNIKILKENDWIKLISK